MKTLLKRSLMVFVVLLIALCFSALTACGETGSNAPRYDSDKYYEYAENSLTASSERIIIYSANLSITVKDCDKTAETIKTKVSAEYPDGYLDYESTGEKRVHLSFRIPKDKLSEFVNFVKATGKVNSCEIYSTDVTENYADAEKKINYLQTYYEQLTSLLNDATEKNDFTTILTISKEMNDVAEQLDKYQHAADGLLSHANLSSVTIDIEKENEYTAAGVWGNIGKIFVDSFKSVGIVFGYIATILVALFPYALIGFGVVCIVFTIIGIVRRSKGKTFFIKKEKRKTDNDEIIKF